MNKNSMKRVKACFCEIKIVVSVKDGTIIKPELQEGNNQDQRERGFIRLRKQFDKNNIREVKKISLQCLEIPIWDHNYS